MSNSVIPNHNFDQFTSQFSQITRSFGIRYFSSIKQKSAPTQSFQELQMQLSKILCPILSGQLDGNVITKLLGLQLKGDYQQVIALSFLQDLNKLTREMYDKFSQEQTPEGNLIMGIFQTIVSESLRVLNSQQQFHTIVPKQNQVLRQLLINPYIINSLSIENYRTVYRRLKDVKEFYPHSIKQQQKLTFLKAIEESIEQIAKYEANKLTEFVFNNLLNQLQILEPSHQLVTSRLKIIKNIIKHLPFFHQDILYKSAFLVAKFSKDILQLPHLFSSIVCLYQDLLTILVKKISSAPLIMFNHLVVNNIKKILEQKIGNTSILCLQILLNLLTKIFNPPYVSYFMKNYDCNFMEEPGCQQALNLLFEFVQNRANQRKSVYEMFKKHLKKATDNIRKFLNDIQHQIQPSSQKLSKFYEVKRKEYLEIVAQMNQKPKKIFKKLQSISNREIREEIMKKYSRIAKKSAHLEMKKMIDLFAANNSTSEQLFAEYVKLLFSNLNKDVNLQEFLRYFSSNFFLNGESQQILRVLDTLTVLYYNHQSNKILKTSDSTYTFANAIILLNCDLHNPQNESKMSEESFYKICKKINNGEDLPMEILATTYQNIKRNKINTFRSKSQLYGISPTNFVLFCSRQQEQKLEYYDMEMRMLTDKNFYDYFIYDLLNGVIDQRETMKLQQLIQRFMYDDKTYECEVIELIRKLKTKKPHTPLHALEKILQWANFKNTKTTEKTLSYLWLAVNLLQNFPQYLPTNVICELLIFTWRLRTQLRDDMYLRQRAQIKRVKKMLREYQKRQSKKSIMDMFSSFLSSKENDSEPETMEQVLMPGIKKMNYKNLTEKIFEVLLKSQLNMRGIQQRVNHREKGIEFFIGYLRNDEQKLFEEFLSVLYLIFHLLWGYNPNQHNQSLSPEYSQVQSPTQMTQSFMRQSNVRRKTSPLKSSLQLSSEISPNELSQSSLQQTIQDLFYELLGLKQSAITKRIQNLKKKDNKKYEMLQNYCRYWVVRILLNRIIISKGIDDQDIEQQKQNHELYLLNKSIEYLQKTDKQTFIDLLYEFQVKVKQLFVLAEKLQLKRQNSLKQDKKSEQEIKKQDIKEEGQKLQEIKIIEEKEYEQNQQQITKDNMKVQNDNNQESRSQTLINEYEHQLQPLVSCFIYSYRTIIQEFYVNCIRVVGREEMNKDKKYRWLVNLEGMLKDVMQNYAQKIQKSTETSQKNISTGENKQNKQSSQNKSADKPIKGDELENNLTEQPTNEFNLQRVQNQNEQKQTQQKNQTNLFQGNCSQQNPNNEIIAHPVMQHMNQLKELQDQLIKKISQQLDNPTINVTQKEQEKNIDKAQSKEQEKPIYQKHNLQQQQNNQQEENQNKKQQQQSPSNKQNQQQNVNQFEPKDQKERIQLSQQLKSEQKQYMKYEKVQQNPKKQQIQQNHLEQKNIELNHQQNQTNLIKQQEQALRKLQQLYSDNMESPQITKIPFYMF